MNNLVNIGKFRFLVNKILPTVYDDSLSYYEVLCKVIEKINEIIAVDNEQNEILMNIPTDVTQFAAQLNQFKNEVNSNIATFENTINNQLDAFETEIRAATTADTTPIQGSTHLITSGGVYAALTDITSRLIVDTFPTQNSTHLVSSGGVYTALQNAITTLNQTIATKQNILTYDVIPTANSSNPVYSGGVYTAINNAVTAVTEYVDSEVSADRRRITANETAIEGLNTNKQNKLTFDLVPTQGSDNPVTSNGIYAAINSMPTTTVDPTPTEGSTNAVSSGGVYNALESLESSLQLDISTKQDELTFDVFPTQNSLNPVTSGGVYTAIQSINPMITIDSVPTQNSPNPVSSGGVYNALQNVEITVDAVPTEGSTNAVSSGGVYNALQNIEIDIDAVPTEDSTNAVSSGGTFDALATLQTEIDTKQNELTWDVTPTQNSTNPVTSGGVYGYVNRNASQPADVNAPISFNFFVDAQTQALNSVMSAVVKYSDIQTTVNSNSNPPASYAVENAINTLSNRIPTIINTSCLLDSTQWVGASAPYTQEINVAGIYASDNPILDIIVSDTVATGIDEINQWEYISKATCGNGTITFSCYTDKPTIDLNISVKVVR